MNELTIILLGWAVLFAALCVAIWRLAKAGGSVDVGFHVSVSWGRSMPHAPCATRRDEGSA